MLTALTVSSLSITALLLIDRATLVASAAFSLSAFFAAFDAGDGVSPTPRSSTALVTFAVLRAVFWSLARLFAAALRILCFHGLGAVPEDPAGFTL